MNDNQKAPKTVRILGNEFTVHPVRPGPMGLGCSGHNDHKKQAIHYDADWSPGKQRETVWHEMIHEVDEQCYLELTERQVHALAALTRHMLLDNPDFARWLIDV